MRYVELCSWVLSLEDYVFVLVSFCLVLYFLAVVVIAKIIISVGVCARRANLESGIHGLYVRGKFEFQNKNIFSKQNPLVSDYRWYPVARK